MKAEKKIFTKNRTLFSPKSGEVQKKKVFTKNRTLFSPNSGGDLRSDANQSQIIGGIYPPRVSALLLARTEKPSHWKTELEVTF